MALAVPADVRQRTQVEELVRAVSATASTVGRGCDSSRCRRSAAHGRNQFGGDVARRIRYHD